ncbi:unnamed protein product [Gadus morhua 'NCC']
MADCSTRVLTSDWVQNAYSSEDLLSVDTSECLLGVCGVADEEESSSASVENGTWDPFGMDQVTMIRIEGTHPEWCQEVRGDGVDHDTDRLEASYALPSEDQGTHFMGEGMTVGDSMEELEEPLVGYADLATEGDSYEFQCPTAEESKPPTGREHLRRPLAKKNGKYGAPLRQRRPDADSTACDDLRSSQSPTSGGGIASEAHRTDPRTKAVVCGLCPPPGKVFKNMAGFSVHLKQLHHNGLGKSFFCGMCQKHCRNQLVLDDHVRRHASKAAVFQCPLCSFKAPGKIRKRGVKGRFGIRVHFEKEHPGIVPECKICEKDFRNLDSYLKDQVRHIGVTPFYCPECQIYEMTERGLLVHMRNHNKEKGRGQGEREEVGEESPTGGLDCY